MCPCESLYSNSFSLGHLTLEKENGTVLLYKYILINEEEPYTLRFLTLMHSSQINKMLKFYLEDTNPHMLPPLLLELLCSLMQSRLYRSQIEQWTLDYTM